MTVRFRYPTAVLAGFAVLVALGLAFVMGRRSGPPLASGTRSTEEVKDDPALINVLTPDDGQIAMLDIPAERPRVARKAVPTRSGVGGGGGAGGAGGTVQKEEAPDRWAGAGDESGLPRVIGLNYVIVQTFHERKDADGARDALAAAGIPCTVERVPKSWSTNPKLFAVIGTHGFARPKTTPKFREYKAEMIRVGKTFAGKSKYLEFNPSGYQWKQEDEDARRKAAGAAGPR